MKNIFLFPFTFKIAGLILGAVSGVLLFLWLNNDFALDMLQYEVVQQDSITFVFEDGNYTNELILGTFMLSLIMIAFSRECVEDERTTLLRLQSLHLTHYINYVILAVWIFATNGLQFVLSAIYLPYVFLFIFLLIYNVRLYLIPFFQRLVSTAI